MDTTARMLVTQRGAVVGVLMVAVLLGLLGLGLVGVQGQEEGEGGEAQNGLLMVLSSAWEYLQHASERLGEGLGEEEGEDVELWVEDTVQKLNVPNPLVYLRVGELEGQQAMAHWNIPPAGGGEAILGFVVECAELEPSQALKVLTDLLEGRTVETPKTGLVSREVPLPPTQKTGFVSEPLTGVMITGGEGGGVVFSLTIHVFSLWAHERAQPVLPSCFLGTPAPPSVMWCDVAQGCARAPCTLCE